MELMETTNTELTTTENTILDTEAAQDIAEARAMYKNLMATGKKGLDVALELVEASEHPRAIEVFSGLISNLAGVNSKLVELHKAKQELREAAPAGDNNGTTNIQNNVYVGSPKDLLELMSGDGTE